MAVRGTDLANPRQGWEHIGLQYVQQNDNGIEWKESVVVYKGGIVKKRIFKVRLVVEGKGDGSKVVDIGTKLMQDLGAVSRGYTPKEWVIETERTKEDLLENLRHFNTDTTKIIVEEE